MRLEHIVTPPIVVSDATQYVPFDIGKSGQLTLLQLAGTANITVDVYSRAFDWTHYPGAGLATMAIRNMEANPDGKLRVTLNSPPPLAIGDLVTLAATSVGGYNSSFRVLALPSRTQVDLDVAYTWVPTSLAAATLDLAIPAEEFGLYRILDTLTTTGLTSLLWGDATGRSLVNTDPWPPGVVRPIYPLYFKFDGTGTFRIAASILRPIHV